MKKLLFLLLAAAGLVFIVGAIVWGSPLTSRLDLGGSSALPPDSTYNVKEFGAAGDGRTDDTPAFEQAIEAAASNGGGDIFVPAGTYMLHPIFLQSDVNLIGEDRDSVTLKLSDDADNQSLTRLVNIEEAENIQIRNLTFDGNAPAHEGGTEHMHTLFIWDSKHIVVDNNRMQHAIGDGVSITGSTQASEDVTISNNILLDNHRSNIVVEQVNDIKIYRNHSTSTIGRPTLHFEPFEEMDLYGAEVYENTFESNATDTYTIQIEGTPEPGNYFHDIRFYNNTIKGLSGRFMIKETKDAEIYNNTFAVKDIYIWFKNDQLHVYDNTINTRNGIIIEGHLGTSIGTQITDNTITTEQNGLTIKTSADGTLLSNNTFTGSGSGRAAYLWATGNDITDTTITNNTFSHFKGGILTDTYDGFVVDGLDISENHFEAIESSAVYATSESSRNVQAEANTLKQVDAIFIEE